MKKNILLIALGAAMALASCNTDDVSAVQSHQGRPIDFRVAMGLNSRGIPVTDSNLDQIVVSAFDDDENPYFTNLTFGKDSEKHFSGYKNYYWPHKGDLTFYAYGLRFNSDNSELDNNDLVPSGTTMEVDPTGITFTSYTVNPYIINQKDLVAAYAKGSKDEYEADGVPLDFHHLLSQIQIDAINNENVFDVYVKAVKICQINGTGNLTFTGDGTKSGGVFNTTTQWDAVSDKQTYSVEYVESGEEPITLERSPKNLNQKDRVGNFMLIPQKLTPWEPKTDPNNNDKGAYISVLVKIVNKDHPTIVLYPGTKLDDGTLVNTDGFAWIAVPIEETWQPGKKYVYTLDFTGGAGYVDPDHLGPEKPGDPTLGTIYCSVAVCDWDSSSETNIDKSLNNE